MSTKIVLKQGRENSLKSMHPWVFSGAISQVSGNPQAGETVDIITSGGEWLARGAWSPKSQISLRTWTFEKDTLVDKDFFRSLIRKAIAYREFIFKSKDTDSFRLVNAESDGLPGIIIDRYSDFLVCQFLSAGAEFWKENLIEILQEELSPRGIYERSDTDSRKKEGMELSSGLLSGEMPPEKIQIHEEGISFYVDIIHGHKTGFYLDQRDNRLKIREYSEGKDVLNCFSYTGGFGLESALAGAASVFNVDTSRDSLSLAEENFALNGLKGPSYEFIEEDVFRLLRTFRDSRRDFDLIILDPPKFISSAAQLKGGARGYKDINLLAFKLLRPGGVLFTFSCSGYMDPALFGKIVAGAAADAGRKVFIKDHLFQGADHSIALNFPESLYLKGLVCVCP